MSSVVRRNHGTGHTYKVDGRPVMGVTTIIAAAIPKPQLIRWSARLVAEYVADADEATLDALRTTGRDGMVAALKEVPFNKTKEAAVRGTEVHKLAERLSKGEEIFFGTEAGQVPPHLECYVDSCLRFLNEWEPVPVLTEAVVGSRGEPAYAGTLDLVADLPDGTRALFDYKTSASGPYREDVVQAAAYRFADFFIGTDGTEVPMSEVGIDAAYVVRLLPSTYEVHRLKTGESRNTSEAFKVFAACAAIAKRANEMKTWIGEAEPRPAAVAA